jgi:Zn-dependent M28 family amino/carboxypeptidase
MEKHFRFSILKALILVAIFIYFGVGCNQRPSDELNFDGEHAYQDMLYQVELGPRIPGTSSHQQIINWIKAELKMYGWSVETQEINYQDKDIVNIIAKRETGTQYILLGAHYDTRIVADRDPDVSLRKEPVPGANDGASGVAVLLEIARVLPEGLDIPVRLVFFDAEDNGGIEDWDWIMGSKAFVENYGNLPELAVIVDMIGDADLNIYYERNSDPVVMERIWDQAEGLGYESYFIPEFKHAVLDDHTPFIEVGIPAVDIIDLDYPYWHTTADTPDKVSQESLEVVGNTLLYWLTSPK